MHETLTESSTAESRAPAPGGPGPVPGGRVAAGALAVGVGGNLLLWGSEGPGLNLLLLFVILAGAAALVLRRVEGPAPAREALAWFVVGLGFASIFVLRGAAPLQFLAFLAAAAAFAFPALHRGGAWLARSRVLDPVEAIGGAVLRAALGPLRGWGAQGSDASAGSPDTRPAARRRPSRGLLPAVLRGLLLALPILLVFGGLFMAADPEFSARVTRTFGRLDPEELAGRVALFGILAWLSSGYLAGLLLGTRVRGWIPPGVSAPTLGIGEVGTVLALLNLLFAAFVAMQLPALFGGAALVRTTPGLTYAGYAREGFGQLVVAAVLVLPLLLAGASLLREESARGIRVFRVLGVLLLLLLGVVIASAFQRVYLYQAAYGLTAPRYYGAAFLGWITLLCAWLGATVLAGRRDRFIAPALVSGYALLALLALSNPDARIAQANLARLGAPVPGAPALDAAYLGTLGADAVPTLLGALPTLPTEARCTVATALERRWSARTSGDWRSWNLAEARARKLVAEAREEFPGASECPRTREEEVVGAEAPARTPGPGG
jgi:hypothetical protein